MSVRFAWPSYERPWAVVLENLQVDGVPRAGHVHIDPTRRRLRLDEVGAWQTVRFDLTASIGDAAPAGTGPLTGVAIVSAQRSNTRIPFRLEPVGDDRCFGGPVVLRRGALAGIADVEVKIAATVGDRRRLVGVGDEWTIVIDPAQAPTAPGRPPFDTAWIDFRAPEAPLVARQQPEAYVVLDTTTTDAKPVLLLNEGIDGLKDLLMAPTARHERRRLREVISTTIARQVTSTLVRAAVNDVVPTDMDDDFEPQRPEDRLHAQVLDALAEEMTTVASSTELYERLWRATRGSVKEQAELWVEVDAAIDRMTGHSSAVAIAVGELKYV